MIDGKKVLAIIPARGGSKRIPRKNIKLMAGKPLLYWSLHEAKKSQFIDRLILSSEDPEIIAVARELGCEVPFTRPAQLAEDATSGLDPVSHAIEALPGYDIVVLLQPTSPLRTVADIDGGLEFFRKRRAVCCVGMSEWDKKLNLLFQQTEQGFMRKLLADEVLKVSNLETQKTYVVNGALYIADTAWFRKNKVFLSEESLIYPMPVERSIDVDTDHDFNVAELLLKQKQCSAP